MHRKKKSGSHCRALPVPVHSETRCLALGKKPTRALARPTRRFDKDRVLQFDCKKIRLVHPPDRLTPTSRPGTGFKGQFSRLAPYESASALAGSSIITSVR